MPLRINLCTHLFAVLETLVAELDDFSETIYRLLIFLLIEWHQNKVLRNHLMTNFVDLFKNEKVLPLPHLVEPLCKIITQNLDQKSKADERALTTYITMADFTFFWALANMK